jgi:hypothetical protein
MVAPATASVPTKYLARNYLVCVITLVVALPDSFYSILHAY